MSRGGQFQLIGISHRTASIEQREQLAIDPLKFEAFYAGLIALPGVQESFALSTCNRLEVYARTNQEDSARQIGQYLCDFNGIPPAEFEKVKMRALDLEAAVHLFEVAAGIDSQIIGETEILGQVKGAYAQAARYGAAGPVLNRLIQKSFQAAKWIRTHTAIGEGQINTATVAVDLATKIFGNLESIQVLVIGAGDIGEKTVKALQSRGARAITVTSRRIETARELAGRFSGQAASLEVISAGLNQFDIVVSSTSSPDPVLGREQAVQAMRPRAHRPLFLVDLAVPRDIEPACADLDNVYLYNIDDLAEIAAENLSQRKAEVVRCRPILAERAGRAWGALADRFEIGSGGKQSGVER